MLDLQRLTTRYSIWNLFCLPIYKLCRENTKSWLSFWFPKTSFWPGTQSGQFSSHAIVLWWVYLSDQIETTGGSIWQPKRKLDKKSGKNEVKMSVEKISQLAIVRARTPLYLLQRLVHQTAAIWWWWWSDDHHQASIPLQNAVSDKCWQHWKMSHNNFSFSLLRINHISPFPTFSTFQPQHA